MLALAVASLRCHVAPREFSDEHAPLPLRPRHRRSPAAVTPEFAEILTPEAMALAAKLQRAFGGRRADLLARRAKRQAGIRSRDAARFPAGDARDPRGRLDLRADPCRHRRPPRRDHGTGRPQDGHQRAQLRRERVHGGFRGREHAAVGQQPAGPASTCATRSAAASTTRRPKARRTGSIRRPPCCSSARAAGTCPRSTC